jgi:general secretion pathway protein K
MLIPNCATVVCLGRSQSPAKGAALLMAMLTVALIGTFAAAALWQQRRAFDIEAAERGRIQARWLLTGALDWARLILREDARAGGADHLGEPWAVPLSEARLGDFLGAGSTSAMDSGPSMLNAFLSGRIMDQQSLMNVANLVDNGKVSADDMRRFGRLYELLGLPPEELAQLAEQLRRGSTLLYDGGSKGAAPLMPQHVEQLRWLGISSESLAALQPHITVLPARTPVNLNTASAEVIYASVDGLSLEDARRLTSARTSSPFVTLADARRQAGSHQANFDQGNISVSSRFFEVRIRWRLEEQAVEERALVQREGASVKTLWRVRGPATPNSVGNYRPRS